MLLGNPFYLEVSSLYETLLDDQLVFGEDDLFLGARNINMIAGDFCSLLSVRKVLSLARPNQFL